MATKKDEPPAKEQDVLLLHSPTDDGEGVRVVRAREDRLEAGEVRPLKEGKPITGEVVKLSPRADQPRVCDVEVLAKGRNGGDDRAAADRSGPPQVATRAYRESWDRVFGAGAADATGAKTLN